MTDAILEEIDFLSQSDLFQLDAQKEVINVFAHTMGQEDIEDGNYGIGFLAKDESEVNLAKEWHHFQIKIKYDNVQRI